MARAKRLLRKMIQQSWVILLLLLIIPAIIFIKREKNINNDDSNVVVQKENTPTTQPIEQNQIPTVVVPQQTQNTTVAADAQKSADDYSNKFVVPDTVTTIVVQEEIVADTSHDFQQRDTIQFNTKTETPHYNLADIFPNDGNGETMCTSSPQWSLEFAYAGSFDEQNFTSQVINLQDIDEGTGKSLIPIVSEDDTIQYTNYHYMPITLTLTAHYRQSKRLGVEAGLSYIRLVSDFETKKDSIVNHRDSLVSAENMKMIKQHFFGNRKKSDALMRLKEAKDFFELKEIMQPLKEKGEIIDYGKYATAKNPELCYLIIYDPAGNIKALLGKGKDKRQNLKTGQEDSISNYRGCGAIWFLLNEK